MSGDRAIRLPRIQAPFAFGHAVARRVIAGVDERLSRHAKVETFSDDPTCILRYAPTRARHAVHLSDGALIAPGDLVIDIHCWNERVPPMPKGGADLAWALKASGGLKASLRLLAAALDSDARLQPARAIRARVNFVGLGGSNQSVSRIIARMGFEDVDEGGGGLNARFHDMLENLLIGALVWTHNPEALRRDKLLRERRPVWASRERLLALHGRGELTS